MKKGNFLKNIIWASYGPQFSEGALDHSIYLGKKFGSKVHALYIKPTTYNELKDRCSEEEDRIFDEWSKITSTECIPKFEKLSDKIKKQKIDFVCEILEGVPCIEILNYQSKTSSDLIVMGKGEKFQDTYIIPSTAKYIIRNSPVPVLTVDNKIKHAGIKKIIVPTDIQNIKSKSLDFAGSLSGVLNSRIIHLNIFDKQSQKVSAEDIERMHGNAYFALSEIDSKFKNIDSVVIDSDDVADGIIEYTVNNKPDLLIIQTYSGEKKSVFHSDSSIAEKIINEVDFPVLTIAKPKGENKNEKK